MPVTLMPVIFVFVSLFGLALGSFASFLAYRVPRRLPVMYGRMDDVYASRSMCTHCQHPLGVRDLIPVLSWLSARGRCCYCGEGISPAYPVLELSSMLLALLTVTLHGVSVYTLFLLFLLPIVLALVLIDLRHMILSDSLVIAVAILALCWRGYQAFYSAEGAIYAVFLSCLSAGVLFFIVAWTMERIMSVVLRKKSLGFGDVKFFLVSGLWLGIASLPSFLIIAGASGVLFGFLWRISGKGNAFPFGPALIFSLYTMLLFPILQGTGVFTLEHGSLFH